MPEEGGVDGLVREVKKSQAINLNNLDGQGFPQSLNSTSTFHRQFTHALMLLLLPSHVRVITAG
jgi:hypothetical protein